LEPLVFDGAAVRSYGLVVAAVAREGRKPRSRFADLLIAATAHANGLDLYTRNGDDFFGLAELVHVVTI
jgi:predicted nucleic acid-binding protein